MEPCLFRHGKNLTWRNGIHDLSWLQWSHVFSDMVRDHRAGLAGADLEQASMEPCLFRHGKEAALAGMKMGLGASMEPCLFRHGKRPGWCGGRPGHPGFNGAMSFQTW